MVCYRTRTPQNTRPAVNIITIVKIIIFIELNMIDHQESVFVNCVMHNVFKFMIIDSLWHLWVWLKAKVELRLCRLSMRRSQAMRWSQAMIDSNTTVTWQQHWFCVHVGEQHPSQLCICWWNSMYQTQTPTTQHWSWFQTLRTTPNFALGCALC